MNRVINILVEATKDTFRDDCFGMASEMAFNFILALFPFAIFIIAIFGAVGTDHGINQIVNVVSVIVPYEALKLIESVLTGITKSSSGGLLTFGLLGSIWAASNAVMVVIKSLNIAYSVKETRSFLAVRGLAFLIVFLLALVIFLASNLIIFGTSIFKLLDQYFYIPYYISFIILFIRWPLTFLFLLIIMIITYYFLPNIHEKRRIKFLNSIPGALFFCIFWLVASWLFGIYVENFGRYNAVYGVLGAAIVLLVWLYYTSVIILIGGEINSEVYKQIRSKTVLLDTR